MSSMDVPVVKVIWPLVSNLTFGHWGEIFYAALIGGVLGALAGVFVPGFEALDPHLPFLPLWPLQKDPISLGLIGTLMGILGYAVKSPPRTFPWPTRGRRAVRSLLVAVIFFFVVPLALVVARDVVDGPTHWGYIETGLFDVGVTGFMFGLLRICGLVMVVFDEPGAG